MKIVPIKWFLMISTVFMIGMAGWVMGADMIYLADPENPSNGQQIFKSSDQVLAIRYYKNGEYLKMEGSIPDGVHTWKVHDIVLERATYKGGLLHGNRRRYYDTGKLKSDEYYVKGTLHGTQKEYTVNGNLKSEIQYKEGIKNGLFTRLHPDGRSYERGEFLNNELHGNLTQTSMDGVTEGIQVYQKGILHGTSFRYGENGDINQEITWEFGKMTHRKSYLFYNGAAGEGDEVIDETFLNGERHGLTRIYRYGKLALDIMYENGKKIQEAHYFDNEDPKRILRYNNNLKDGIELRFSEVTGLLNQKIEWKLDKKIKVTLINPDGTEGVTHMMPEY